MVQYLGPQDPGFDDFIKKVLDNWCKIFWGHTNWEKILSGSGTAEGSFERDHNWHFTQTRDWFKKWPRGDGPGMFLHTPIPDNSRVEDRGVAKEWMAAVWDQIRAHYWWLPPTRAMIDGYFRYLTREAQCTVYFFIPPRFRKKPDTFISHAWDTAAHCLFKAAAEKRGNSFWMDAIAVDQWNPGSDVAKIGEIVQSIGNTVLVIRGQGDPRENLRVMYRSWCVYEIVHTPDGCLHASITAQNGDHGAYSKAIDTIRIEEAQAVQQSDKREIDRLVLARFGDFDAANRLLRRLMKKEYYKFFCEGHGFNGDRQKGESFGAHYYGRNHD